MTAQEKNKAVSAAEVERQEREKAEVRLRVAEEALSRLDRALRKSGVKVRLLSLFHTCTHTHTHTHTG